MAKLQLDRHIERGHEKHGDSRRDEDFEQRIATAPGVAAGVRPPHHGDFPPLVVFVVLLVLVGVGDEAAVDPEELELLLS